MVTERAGAEEDSTLAERAAPRTARKSTAAFVRLLGVPDIAPATSPVDSRDTFQEFRVIVVTLRSWK